MSERDDQPIADDATPDRQQSVANPFDEREDNIDERPQLNVSKKRVAAMGTAFGLVMALLAFVCVAVSFALSSCTA